MGLLQRCHTTMYEKKGKVNVKVRHASIAIENHMDKYVSCRIYATEIR